MTTVNSGNTARITDPALFFRSGYNLHTPQAMGVEAEFFATKSGEIASPASCDVIVSALQQQGYAPSLEFAGIIEYAGPPFEVGDIAKLTATSHTAYQAFASVADKHGHVLEQTSHLATLSAEEAEAKVGSNPRAQAGLKSMQMNAPLDCRLLPLMNAAVQVSLNVRNDQELFDTLALANRLTPFIYGVFANHPPVFNGEDCSRYHARGKLYEAYGGAAGISSAFKNASTPEELVDGHMRDLVKTPLFFTFSSDSNDIVIPRNCLPVFSTLPLHEQTASNFNLAQSFNYPDNKICDIRGSDGKVIGKRVEVRAFDTGEENLMAAPVFCALALRTPAVTAQVEALLADYGFSGAPKDYAPLLQQARQAAVYHGGKYADVAFGRRADGSEGRMTDFARSLGEILGEAVKQHPAHVQHALSPILKRCKSGISRAQELA